MPKNHTTRTEQQSPSVQSKGWKLHCHVGSPQIPAVKGTDGTVALKWQQQFTCRGPWRSGLLLALSRPMSPPLLGQWNGWGPDGHISSSFFIPSLPLLRQLPSLQVLHRLAPGCQGMWRPRPTLYHFSRGQWMFHLGICHLICRCPMVLGERESLLLPVTSWQHCSQHVGGGPCWNDS